MRMMTGCRLICAAGRVSALLYNPLPAGQTLCCSVRILLLHVQYSTGTVLVLVL